MTPMLMRIKNIVLLGFKAMKVVCTMCLLHIKEKLFKMTYIVDDFKVYCGE